ncbi:hypothetical protein BOTCAL_0123g00070 [Botryotinia calthae]|uniref:Uncharacterized protein n=1 Tax=Botryotinia calthae TaxID=38488 RepID=A0A4Y8D4W2_9HELO|nr:hypothetical protein BOTCAL_0123g00070 [Botryotinia calthae]
MALSSSNVKTFCDAVQGPTKFTVQLLIMTYQLFVSGKLVYMCVLTVKESTPIFPFESPGKDISRDKLSHLK